MAEGVVHGLEIVEVEEQERAVLLVAPGVRHRLARALGEHRAVGQSGERVVVREEFQPPRIVLQLDGGIAQVFLRALELGDVVGEQVEAVDFALGSQVRHARHLQRAPRGAFAEGQLELHVGTREAALDLGAHAAIGLVAEDLGDRAPLHAFVRNAEPLVVRAIRIAVALLAIDVGDERRHVVGDEPQPLLALAQRALGLFHALGGAAVDDDCRGEQQSRTGDEDMQHQLARPRTAAGEPGADRRDDLRAGREDQDGRADADEQRGERTDEMLHRCQ